MCTIYSSSIISEYFYHYKIAIYSNTNHLFFFFYYNYPYPHSPYIVSIAWSVQRILSAFHSAMRGGIIFSRNILEYLSKMNYIHINHEETMLDEAVGYGLALIGLYFQLAYGFGLPFPLNILLLPFRMAEYFLIWIVNN